MASPDRRHEKGQRRCNYKRTQGQGEFTGEALFPGSTTVPCQFSLLFRELVPGVAESVSVSDDGKTFTFKIRAGQTFASGNPVTAGAMPPGRCSA